MKKVMNGLAISPWMAMSRFWGLPMGLATLPIVTAKASESNKALGGIADFLARDRTTGVPMMARVSFISKVDNSPGQKIKKRTRVPSDLARPKSREVR